MTPSLADKTRVQAASGLTRHLFLSYTYAPENPSSLQPETGKIEPIQSPMIKSELVPSTSFWAQRAPGLASCLRVDLDYWLPWSTQGPGLLGCPSFLVYPVPHGVSSFYGLNLISDSLELDLNPNHREALGTEDNKSNRQHLLHCFSLCSTRQGSSHTGGIQPNSQQGECEMSVDEPTLQYDSVGRHLVASGAAAAVRTHGTTVEVSYRTR